MSMFEERIEFALNTITQIVQEYADSKKLIYGIVGKRVSNYTNELSLRLKVGNNEQTEILTCAAHRIVSHKKTHNNTKVAKYNSNKFGENFKYFRALNQGYARYIK